MNKKTGFTLAEVLVTLAIIGVVAALTIPTVVRNYQKQETVVKLKKNYSIINQAYQKAQADYGDSKTWSDFITSSDKTGAQLDAVKEKYFLPYLKAQKSCPSNKSNQCFAYSSATPKTIDGISGRFYPNNAAISCFVLADGTSICLHNSSYGSSFLVFLFVDINGKKGPNMMGRDIFSMEPMPIGKKKYLSYVFYAQGRLSRTSLKNHSDVGCKKGYKDERNGETCGAMIVADGWEIKDDYPF